MRAGAIRHGWPVRTFFLRTGGTLIHQRTRAGRENDRFGFHHDVSAGFDFEQHRADDTFAIG